MGFRLLYQGFYLLRRPVQGDRGIIHPSHPTRRCGLIFVGGKASVRQPPFAQPNELIAGFWIIEAPSKEAAVDWARRAPFVDGEIEVRQIFEAADFPAEILPPEEAAKEQAWRDAQHAKAAARR